MPQWLPVNLGGALNVEVSQPFMSFGLWIDQHYLVWIDRAFPVCEQKERRRLARYSQIGVDALRHFEDQANIAAGRRQAE